MTIGLEICDSIHIVRRRRFVCQTKENTYIILFGNSTDSLSSTFSCLAYCFFFRAHVLMCYRYMFIKLSFSNPVNLHFYNKVTSFSSH